MQQIRNFIYQRVLAYNREIGCNQRRRQRMRIIQEDNLNQALMSIYSLNNYQKQTFQKISVELITTLVGKVPLNLEIFQLYTFFFQHTKQPKKVKELECHLENNRYNMLPIIRFLLKHKFRQILKLHKNKNKSIAFSQSKDLVLHNKTTFSILKTQNIQYEPLHPINRQEKTERPERNIPSKSYIFSKRDVPSRSRERLKDKQNQVNYKLKQKAIYSIMNCQKVCSNRPQLLQKLLLNRNIQVKRNIQKYRQSRSPKLQLLPKLKLHKYRQSFYY